jgi:hypothetical protein
MKGFARKATPQGNNYYLDRPNGPSENFPVWCGRRATLTRDQHRAEKKLRCHILHRRAEEIAVDITKAFVSFFTS